jgi:hypothetical protein
MRFNRKFATVGAVLFLLLTGCSEAPQPAAQKKAPPPEPVTGESALFKMYSVARLWAEDIQTLRARSIRLSEVKSQEGKSGAWEATFVSESKGRARTYTFSVVEAEGNLHEGVFAGLEEAYAGPRGQEKPFPTTVIRVDTDKAYTVAVKQGEEYAKKNPKMPISFLLEFTPRHTVPAWRVVWGESVTTSAFSVLVNAISGDYLETLR